MTRHWNSISRKLAPLLTAGVLLQAGGCEFDAAGLGASLLTAIANSLITGFVYGAFNLI